MRYELQHVHYMPKKLEQGMLYVSKEFDTAAHICPCGCGSKIRTPLGPNEWSFKETKRGPSLYPSIGNWQLPCKSHYWIREGTVIWSDQWTQEEISNGYNNQVLRRKAYYNNLHSNSGWWKKISRWLRETLR